MLLSNSLMLPYSCIIPALLLAAISAERDWGYFGYEEHVIGEGIHLSTTLHNPFLNDKVVKRNVETERIPERHSGHQVERREIFGEDDRSEVNINSIPEESRMPELATVR